MRSTKRAVEDRVRSVPSRRAATRASSEEGFGLVELVVAISVLAVLSLAFMGGMLSALKAYTVSRAQTSAEQVATDWIETIRRMGYDQVGIVGGNPAGTLDDDFNQVLDNYTYRVVTDVEFVDDPVPTAAVTQADYKRVTVTVTQVGNSKPDASLQTLVAPPSAASADNALLDVSVVDANNSVLSGATVNLLNGPSAPRSDTTNSQGEVVFASLTPNPTSGATAYYNLTATLAGYMTSYDDLTPSSTVRWQLAKAQSQNTTIHMFKPVSIVVNLKNSNGTPFTTVPMTVTLHSARGDADIDVPSSGTVTITQAYGEYLMPLSSYTVSATDKAGNGPTYYVTPTVSAPVPPTSTYPTTLQSTFDLTVSSYTLAPLNIRLYRAGTSPGCAASGTTRGAALNVNVTGGSQNISVTGKTSSSGVLQFLVPTGSAPYTVTIPKQGSYQGSGTAVVTGTTSCNIKVG